MGVVSSGYKWKHIFQMLFVKLLHCCFGTHVLHNSPATEL